MCFVGMLYVYDIGEQKAVMIEVKKEVVKNLYKARTDQKDTGVIPDQNFMKELDEIIRRGQNNGTELHLSVQEIIITWHKSNLSNCRISREDCNLTS